MQNEKITAAMDLTALLTILQLSKEIQKPTEDVLLSFMESNTGRMLYDDNVKLWWEGPSSIAEEYLNEV